MGNKLGRKRQIVDERYTKPQQGLYMSKDVDIKKLKKLILESKLAPCYPGDDESSYHHDLEECPICFLYYPSLNRSRCCMKSICTECFLRMKSPNSAQPTQCPFCKTSNYAVEYRGGKTKEEKSIEQIEEQRVIEAKIRMRQKEVEEDEERMQKRLESFSSSSSTSAATVDTEYGSAAEDEEIVSSQDSCLPSHPQVTRDGQSDFDLEDIMVMEAIWLSMQEPGIQRNTSPDEISEKDHNVEPSTPSSSSPSGGLACAIAVLAERQQMVGESSSNQNVNVASHNMVPGNCNNSPYNTIEQDSNHYLQGAGTSYTRSDIADDSASEISREVTWQ